MQITLTGNVCIVAAGIVPLGFHYCTSAWLREHDCESILKYSRFGLKVFHHSC